MKITGWRTYTAAALLGVLATAHALGYVDDSTFQTLQGFLLGGGLAGLRAAK